MPARRWAWVEVDRGAILENVRALAGLTPPGCGLMAVVKADGYGHGAETAARAALSGGAGALGVATVHEGVSLREAGITAPVHLLAECPPDAVGEVMEHELTPTVASRDAALAMSGAAGRAGKAVAFHLKVDTGMNRIGVRAEDAGDLVLSLKGLPGLAMEGVFTHFATAEVPGDWDFQHQLERFQSALASIKNEGFAPGVVHAANTAATVLHGEAHFDMVRCGIGIYGLHPGEATRGAVDLVPAMSVKARVVAVKEIAMGEGVSYGLTWRASGPTTIATVPVGYADGLHRVLSGRMRVLIGGVACPQVGRICMDQSMVEVPRGTRVSPGDEVVLVGTQGDQGIGMDELAEAAGTINYELACGFAMRMDRVSV